MKSKVEDCKSRGRTHKLGRWTAHCLFQNKGRCRWVLHTVWSSTV